MAKHLRVVCAAGLYSLCSPLFAQTSNAVVAAADQGNSQVSEANLGEVVVTARRRAESINEVPIAITALSAIDLQTNAITTTDDLSQVVPGLDFVQNGAHAQPYIRGIGQQAAGVGTSANVSLYIDGVYQPVQSSNDFAFNDVERVEVLKGPQGTLYGRNSTGGAISVVTKDPSFTSNGDFSLGYGRFNDRNAQAYVDQPISNTVSANLAINYDQNDGFIRDVATGSKIGDYETFGVYGKLLVKPNDAFSIILAAHYNDLSDDREFAYVPVNNQGSIALGTDSPGTILPNGRYQVSQNGPALFKNEHQGVSATMKLDVGFADVTSVTAYDHINFSVGLDEDATNQPLAYVAFTELDDNIYQELYLTSKPCGPLIWIAGATYFWQNGGYFPFDYYIGTSPAPFTLGPRTRDAAYAFYAEGTYNFLEQLSFTGGLRYSDEKKSMLQSADNAVLFDNTDSWSDVTYTSTLKYDFTKEVNVYATAKSGFTAGNWSGTSTQTTAVNPEKIQSYELGLKAELWKDTRLDVALFTNDYKDLQVTAGFNPTTGTSTLQNAASARTEGGEIQIESAVTSELSTQIGISYLDAYFTSFPDAVINVPNPAGGTSTEGGNLTGYTLPKAPKWQLDGGLAYTHRFTQGALQIATHASYTTTSYWDLTDRLKQTPYTIVNGEISWAPPGDRWKLALWGKNLTNTKYYSNLSVTGLGDTGVYGLPIEYGLRAYFRY